MSFVTPKVLLNKQCSGVAEVASPSQIKNQRGKRGLINLVTVNDDDGVWLPGDKHFLPPANVGPWEWKLSGSRWVVVMKDKSLEAEKSVDKSFPGPKHIHMCAFHASKKWL